MLRFDNGTAIPQGTTITSASIRFIADNSQSTTTTKVTIKTASNTTMPSSYSDWSSRTRGTNSVAWTIGATTSGVDFFSPDITSLIQEAVNNGAFSGVFIVYFDDNGSSTGATRSGYSYEGNNTASPQLTVNYDVQTSRLYARFTENVNETNEFGLIFSDVQGLQVDYFTGSNPYASASFLGAGTTFTCSATTYYREGQWKAEVSTAAASVKWRVRIPSSKAAKDTSCATHTTTQANVFTATTVTGFVSGVDNYTVGLGVWP